MASFLDQVNDYRESLQKWFETMTDGLTTLIVGALDGAGDTLTGTSQGIGAATASFFGSLPIVGGMISSIGFSASNEAPEMTSEKLGNFGPLKPIEPLQTIEQVIEQAQANIPDSIKNLVTDIRDAAVALTTADANIDVYSMGASSTPVLAGQAVGTARFTA